MESNNEKCSLLSFNLNETPIVVIDGNVIAEVPFIKDLGVTVDRSLKWCEHVDNKLKKCYSAFHLLKRNIPFSTPSKTKLNLFQSCVLSILYYASQVWHPNVTSTKKMELLQKRGLRWVTGGHSYKENLLTLKCLPVPLTLIYHDLCFLNKLLNNCYDLDVQEFLSLKEVTRLGLRSSGKIQFKVFRVQKKRTNYSYFNRIVRLANTISLQTNIDIFSLTNSVKSKLKEYLLCKTASYDPQLPCTWTLS